LIVAGSFDWHGYLCTSLHITGEYTAL
jgi:hypothetical protein